jgi:iron complex transport system substrate-binding protein
MARRLLLVLLSLFAAFALLGACSSSDDDSGGGDDSASEGGTDDSVADGAVETAQPEATTIEHEYGTTEVPADPQAIAALGEEFLLADLFSLGLGERVTVSTSTLGDGGAMEDLGFDIDDIALYVPQDTDVEELFAEEPDLILALPYVVDEVGYDVLSQIAPTVPLTQEEDWQANYRNLAASFGPQVEGLAEEQLADYEEAVTAAGEQLGGADRTVSVATVYSGNNLVAWADGPIDVPATLLDMGFTLAPGADAGSVDSSGRLQLSTEQIGLLDGDDLIMMQTEGVDGEDAAIQSVTEQELWQRLPAVESDHVHTVDRLGYPGLPGRLALIGELQTLLAT